MNLELASIQKAFGPSGPSVFWHSSIKQFIEARPTDQVAPELFEFVHVYGGASHGQFHRPTLC